jgi:DNA gyrase subunit A
MAANDELVGLEIFSPEEFETATVLTITENGFGKRSPISDYAIHARGGKGVITIKVNQRNGRVVALLKARDGDQIMMITDAGKITRNRVAEISVVGRNTQGVRVFRIDPEKERLVSVALLPDGEELERAFRERMAEAEAVVDEESEGNEENVTAESASSGDDGVSEVTAESEIEGNDGD